MTDSAQPTSDAALIAAVAGGSVSALETLYQRYGHALLAYLIGQIGERTLAEEVLQDVMLAVWQGAGNFRKESSVHTWLLAITRRQAIRARQRQRPEAEPIADDLRAESEPLLEILERQALHTQVRTVLDQLPDNQRETLELIFFHELTAPEVAAVMNVAIGTVKSRLYRAKSLLEKLLRLQEVDHA